MFEERGEPTVEQNVQQRGAHRPEDAGIPFDNFPAGNSKEVNDIVHGKPILMERWRFKAHFFGEGEDGTPKGIVEIEDEASVLEGVALDMFEESLDVRHIVDEIGENDVIELFVALKLGRFEEVEFQLRMAPFGLIKDRRAEID